jgi:cytoskeletal protein CcmA (bactofilin family)
MSDAHTHLPDDAFINSIIGEGTRFKGELDLNGLLRIDGDFTGTIRTSGKILVGRNGRAECTLHAGMVVIGGVVRGEVFGTEKVIILSTGLMLGNITTPRLIVEEGVIFNGVCRVSAPAIQPAPKGNEIAAKPSLQDPRAKEAVPAGSLKR